MLIIDDGKNEETILPFKIDDIVYVWENHPYYTEEWKCIGRDHLGAIERRVSIEHEYWEITAKTFCYSLLDDYPINQIYKSKKECEKNPRSAF